MSELTLRPSRPNQTAIKYLEQLLQKAKDGKLQAFAFVGEADDGDPVLVQSVIERKTNLFQMIGALESMKTWLTKSYSSEFPQ